MFGQIRFYIALTLAIGVSHGMQSPESPYDFNLEPHKWMDIEPLLIEDFHRKITGAGLRFVLTQGKNPSGLDVEKSITRIQKSNKRIESAARMVEEAKKFFGKSYVYSVDFLEYFNSAQGFGKSHFRPINVGAVFLDDRNKVLEIRTEYQEKKSGKPTIFKFSKAAEYSFAFSNEQFSALLQSLGQVTLANKKLDRIISRLRMNNKATDFTVYTYEASAIGDVFLDDYMEYKKVSGESVKEIWAKEGKLWAELEAEKETKKVTGYLVDKNGEGAKIQLVAQIADDSKSVNLVFGKQADTEYKFTEANLQQLAYLLNANQFTETDAKDAVAKLSNPSQKELELIANQVHTSHRQVLV